MRKFAFHLHKMNVSIKKKNIPEKKIKNKNKTMYLSFANLVFQFFVLNVFFSILFSRRTTRFYMPPSTVYYDQRFSPSHVIESPKIDVDDAASGNDENQLTIEE
jgi:hypothetical protein